MDLAISISPLTVIDAFSVIVITRVRFGNIEIATDLRVVPRKKIYREICRNERVVPCEVKKTRTIIRKFFLGKNLI